MNVEEIMSRNPRISRVSDKLNRPAQLMWENACGCIPVLDDADQVIGMVTDRDVCMAAWTQGRPLSEIPVEVAMAQDVVACRPEDDVSEVLARLQARHVRRLPVVDDADQLLGVISLVDIARAAERPGASCTLADVAATLVAISATPPEWSAC